VSVGGGGVASLGIDDIPLATDNSYKRDGGASTFGKSDGSQYPFVIAYGGYGGSRGINTAAGSISGSTSYPTNLAYYIKKEGNGYIPGGAGGIGLVSGSVNGRTGYDDGWLNFRTKATSVGVDTGSLDAFDLPPSHYNFANEFVRDFELFFRNITSKVSTTGGGGGGGISRTNVGYRGGRGGAIANLRDTNFAVNWINAEPPKDSIGITKFDNPITNTSAPSLRFYNTLIGMGGRGGSRQTGFLDLPTAGGKYGGGGGGGRATTTNQTTTPTDSYGAAGGNGVVVIISEA
jgi:hypothetical protein